MPSLFSPGNIQKKLDTLHLVGTHGYKTANVCSVSTLKKPIGCPVLQPGNNVAKVWLSVILAFILNHTHMDICTQHSRLLPMQMWMLILRTRKLVSISLSLSCVEGMNCIYIKTFRSKSPLICRQILSIPSLLCD